MRDKRDDRNTRDAPSAPDDGDRLPGSWRRELEARGVDAGFAEALAPVAEAASPDFAHGYRAGVVAAYAVHRDALARLRATLRDVDEVGRLMDAFGGELEKLDEALRVLAAYLERMRVRSGGEAPQRLVH